MDTAQIIVPYDDRWPAAFNEIARELRAALGDQALRIDHIGSTSVPGLAAKDIIDIQVTVAALDDATLTPALAALGYTRHPGVATDHVPAGGAADPAQWRKRYFHAPPAQRPTHLHVRQAGRANQHYPLLFRDYLRATPAAVASYAAIKQAIGHLYAHNADAYYAVKDPVCDLIIDAAQRWAATTGYTPGPSDR